MSYLGIDIGSSQVKATVFDAAGNLLAEASFPYRYTQPQRGWMELDGNEVMEGAFKVIASCAKTVCATDPVRALACSSQGEAFSPLDAHGNILAPAMISGDTRASETIRAFTAKYGVERLYHQTGHTASAMFSIAKLLWLRENQPDIFNRSHLFLCFEDLLAYRLTSCPVMGYPLAGRTMLFDVIHHQWVPELLEACGITADQLAAPLPSGTLCGALRPDVATELGLSPDVRWVTGGHDQVIGAYGCGARRPGCAMYAAGSVECMVPILSGPVLSDELAASNLCTYDFARPGTYASVAYSLTGSNLAEYFIREIIRDPKQDYAQMFADMPDGPTDLLAIPYFTASGTPYFDDKTPGCLYGWRFDTGRGTVLKALLEGVAMEMKLNAELLHQNDIALEQLIATGGGFRSQEVVQLHADILDMPISLIGVKEAGCRGAASLAALALDSVEIPAPKVIREVTPSPERSAQYAERFKLWKNFSDHIRSF